MSDTAIEWATKVWNVTRGCRRVSPGCGGPHNEGGCYAERQAMRMSGPGGAYEGLVELTARGPRWTGKGRFATDKLDEPLRWKAPRDGSRHRVFVDSMSDLFFEEFTNEQIAAVFGVMAACPQHDFLVLTKRPKRMRQWFEWASLRECLRAALDVVPVFAGWHLGAPTIKEAWDGDVWPLPNVHLGVSVEDQQRADERIPLLLETPAAVRFVSAEPLLGPVDFTRIRNAGEVFPPFNSLARWTSGTRLDGSPAGPQNTGIDWIVCGGESGPGARPCDVAWIRSIVEQCRAASVPVFVKQLGPRPLGVRDELRRAKGLARIFYDAKGGDPAEWPPDLRVRELPEVSR